MFLSHPTLIRALSRLLVGDFPMGLMEPQGTRVGRGFWPAYPSTVVPPANLSAKVRPPKFPSLSLHISDMYSGQGHCVVWLQVPQISEHQLLAFGWWSILSP